MNSQRRSLSLVFGALALMMIMATMNASSHMAEARKCRTRASSSVINSSTTKATTTKATTASTPVAFSSSAVNDMSTGGYGDIASTTTSSVMTKSSSVNAATSSEASSSTPSATVATSSDLSTPTPASGYGDDLATVSDKGVFAHFMVGIVPEYKIEDWQKDMRLAMAAGIDAFALNVGTDPYTASQLMLAYTAAQSIGFKVFVSIDFNWYATGNTAQVAEVLRPLLGLPAQYRHNNKAFVSSFAGDAFDWAGLKTSLAGTAELFVIPNVQAANANAKGLDGAFNWMGWPSANNRAINANMTLDGDKAYINALAGKPYMAPASPWFFTHYGPEVSYSKNWLFSTDTLWPTRWQQMLELQPNFIEIVTWNDYGESHYVGPLETAHGDDGNSKWTTGMPHDAWLTFALPYIAAYKKGLSKPIIKKDQLVYWYRPYLKDVTCPNDNCGSKPDGWQYVSDNVYVAAMLTESGTVTVTSGSNAAMHFSAPAGVSVFAIPMGVGKQQFTLTTSSAKLQGTSPKAISDTCSGVYNFNAYTGVIA